jgi:Zn-dependent M28 family amino/carboxypeptidase
MKKLFIATAALGLLAACGETDTTAEKGATPTGEMAATTAAGAYQITPNSLAAHIKTLSSDAYGGRAPGTPGEELTVAYITKAFKDAGLSPANGDSFTQNVPLASVETLGTPVLTLAKNGAELTLNYRSDMVVWTRREQTATTLADSEMVFVGYGINAPERGWNDYEGIDVKGKTVVMLINDPGYATQDTALFNGNAMTYYGRWDYKFGEAARQGAAGAIMIHDTLPAAYPWDTVDSSWTGPQFQTVRDDKGMGFAAAEAWITTSAADKLFKAAGLDRAALQIAATKPGFKAIPMGMTASTGFESKLNHVQSRNVAGIIKGSKAPDDVFIYMAHWDHIGTDATIEGDGIYNGALDNATGTAGLIELARKYAAGPAPKRSVMFLAVTAEEQGLLGSAYYAAHPLVPLKDTLGALNMDGLNYYGPTSDVTVTGLGNSELDDYLRAAAATQDRVLVPDSQPEKGYFFRSDHFELSKLGVPTIYPNAGNVHREFGREYVDQKRADYLKYRYHKPADEYGDDWDLTGAVEDLNLYFTTGHTLSEGNAWPNWVEGSAFKALRDKQRAK